MSWPCPTPPKPSTAICLSMSLVTEVMGSNPVGVSEFFLGSINNCLSYFTGCEDLFHRPVGGGFEGFERTPLGRQTWQKLKSNVRLMMMWTGQKKSEQQKNMDGWPTVYRSMYSQCNWVSKIGRPNYEYPKKPDSAREYARLCFVTIVCWLPWPPYWIMRAQFSCCAHDSLI